MDIIEINNLSFRYKDNFVYDNFSLNVKRGTWVTIAGCNGSGKSTLVKLIAGLEKSYGEIKIFNKVLNKKNLLYIRKNVGFCFDIPENFFACETVEDELAFSLENLGVFKDTIRKKIKEITKLLSLESILKKNPYELSGGEKQKVSIACALMLEPRILVFDESFMMIDINEREKIYKVLKDYCINKRVTILSFTYNLNEFKYSDRLIILNDGNVVIDGGFPQVFNYENIIRKAGVEVPFEIELCKKLKIYNLIDKDIFDLKGMVNELWK